MATLTHASPSHPGWRPHRIARRTARAALGLTLIVAMLGTTACRLPVRQRTMELVADGHDPVRLRGSFSNAYFFEGPTHTTVYLSDIPLSELLAGGNVTGQVVHIEVLWKPKAGRTPIESTATNAAIRHVLLVDGEVAIYGGAGFVWLHGQAGRRTRMTVRDASMALLQSTDAFDDRFTPSTLRGTFVARRNERQTLELRQAISQIVTDAFDESRFVGLPDAGPEVRPGAGPDAIWDASADRQDAIAVALADLAARSDRGGGLEPR